MTPPTPAERAQWAIMASLMPADAPLPRLLAALIAMEVERDAALAREQAARYDQALAEDERDAALADRVALGESARVRVAQVEAERDAARDEAAGWRAAVAPQVDRLTALAAELGVPVATLLRMAVDDLLEDREPPSFAEAADYLFAKNAELYQRLAARDSGATPPPLPDPTQPQQVGWLEDAE